MISKFVLFPYYLTLKIRNSYYDKSSSRSYCPSIPTIGIGNVNVGGTGKTPLTDYVVSYLGQSKKVVVLSKGYKSKNKKFTEVEIDDISSMVGDEPLLLKRRHPELTVVIDKDKTHGVKAIEALDESKKPDVIVIDDVLQHRRLTPTKNIVTIDYSSPIFDDNLLPIGSLRDLPEQIKRADAIVITKCPNYLDQWEREKVINANKIRKTIPVFFSTYQYETAKPVFQDEGDGRYVYSKEALLVTGIAHPKPMIMELTDRYDKVYHIKFGDHHNFSRKDINRIRHFARKNSRAAILTTEKDAQRLRCNRFLLKSSVAHSRLFYIPISLKFLTPEEESEFCNLLLN